MTTWVCDFRMLSSSHPGRPPGLGRSVCWSVKRSVTLQSGWLLMPLTQAAAGIPTQCSVDTAIVKHQPHVEAC